MINFFLKLIEVNQVEQDKIFYNIIYKFEYEEFLYLKSGCHSLP